jgi:hypothetical protein
MTTDREVELIFEVAERYGMTTLEVVRMARLCAWGPFGARQYEQCGIYEPGDDEHYFALHVAKRVAEGAPISELLELRRQLHEILLWLCESEPDLGKRAAMVTELREFEQECEAIRQKARREIERRKRGRVEIVGRG